MSSNPTIAESMEKRAGLLLLAASALALLLANSPFAYDYHHLLDLRFGPVFPRLGTLSLHQWVADAAMAIFFLLVGLEIKREWIEGRLAGAAERCLPIIAAAAGMAMPALVYLGVTNFDPQLIRGWAIPAATDIAFAIGILAILGRHAPASIKLLLVTIAIVDDIGAVIVIALAYTADLDFTALAGALGLAAAMAAVGRLGYRKLWPFLAGFVLLWLLLLASGVHPTIAGVLAALTVPLAKGEPRSPLKRLEHALHPWVMFVIVPLFGLVSAGVSLSGGPALLVQPLPLGVALGLLIGKQLGVFAAIWTMVRTGLAPMPGGATWRHVHGAALLCGIGFTMSLFIAALAFPADPSKVDAAKIGILSGSLTSALAGWAMLRFSPPAQSQAGDVEEVGELFAADER